MGANYVSKMGEDMNRFFTKEDIPITNKHMERCSTSLAIPKSKPGEILLHDHESVSNEKDHNKCWSGCEGIGSLIPYR